MFGHSKRSKKPGYGKKFHEEMKHPSRWPYDGPSDEYGLAGVKQEGKFFRTSPGKGGGVRTIWFMPDKEKIC